MTKTQANEPGFVVSRLDWLELENSVEDGSSMFTASTAIGEYHIWPVASGGWAVTVPGTPGAAHDSALRLDDAFAFAQSNLERRVLSCLSPVAGEEADAKVREPVGFAFEVLWHNDTWCLDFSEMPPVAPAGGEIRNVRPLYAATPSTPSPQIGKAGAGPVGEAVAWRFRFKLGDGLSAWEVTLDESYARSMAVNGGQVEPLGPVEEPGEVECLTRELADLRDKHENACNAAALLNQDRETAEAALAETRERLKEKLHLLRFDLMKAFGAEQIVRSHHVQSVDDVIAVLTGDAQEAGR